MNENNIKKQIFSFFHIFERVRLYKLTYLCTD